MSGVEAALREEYPEATKAECERFAKACEHPSKDADAVKEEAEKMLENYLDWRSCYGLDYEKSNIDGDASENPDAADWDYAIRKAIEVNESVKRAKETKEKLRQAEKKVESDDAPPKVSYDIDLSDSQKDPSENEEANEVDTDATNKDEDNNIVELDEALVGKLPQMVFIHTDKDGKKIRDKSGKTIIHVLSGMINRVIGGSDVYGLAFCFYLDRKFDRESNEKYTVLLDVRAGEGWPNPVALMMVKFARSVAKQLQGYYPERLHQLILVPVPAFSMHVWSACKVVFRAEVMKKVFLVPGPALRDSLLPEEALLDFVDRDVLKATENVRENNFTPFIDGGDGIEGP